MSTTIRIRYHSEAELKRKLFAIYMSLEGWQSYRDVKERFAPHTHPATFSMRLRRFRERGGTFPEKRGAAGRKLLELKVTPELAEHLVNDSQGAPRKLLEWETNNFAFGLPRGVPVKLEEAA